MKIFKMCGGIILLATGALVPSACSNSDDNNAGLDYEKLRVNFSAKSQDSALNPDAEVGVFATCTHSGTTGFNFAANKRYIVGGPDGSYLTGATDADAIVAEKTDHNYRFYAYYPFNAAVTDPAAVAVEAPAVQVYSRGLASYNFMVAHAEPTGIIADVELDFQPVFSVLEVRVANDLLSDEGQSQLRSITFHAPEGCNLASSGVYDLTTGTYEQATGTTDVTIDFGAEGLLLSSAFTTVSAVVAPLTVPGDGMEVTVEGVDGTSVDTRILISNTPTVIAGGSVVSTTLERENDGITAVTFPVEWLLGHGGTDRHPVTAANQPLWISAGIWTCDEQNNAVATWVRGENPDPSVPQVMEFVNSGKISSVGVKGLWTGDYLEFDLPVKKFAAGAVVNMSLPLYGRQIPVFWDIDYLDGDEWKTVDKTLKKAYDPTYSMECSFVAKRGAVLVNKALPFENEIKSGHIKIRLRVADGSVQADTDTKCAKRTTPWKSGAAYGAPFYFYDTTGELTSIKFEL